jgi:tetrahydromethanopterin S-methyltransferase subunit B
MSSESLNQPQNTTALNSKLIARLGFGFLIGLVLLFFLAYQMVAFEITCARTPEKSVECLIVPHSALMTLVPIKVEHPLAVDVTQKKPLIHSPEIGDSMRKSYRAELRMEDHRDSLILIRSSRYETIQKIADTINQFLQDPSTPSFQAYLPEGRMKQNSTSN